MRRFMVRTNCEFSLVVEAENEEGAFNKASEQDAFTWSQAWAPMEAEPTDDEVETPKS